MYIESLELKNFRNYEELSIVLDPGTNILYGDNAQGKTNVLEAVYLCGTTKSHRGSKDKEMIRFEQDESHIRMMVKKDGVSHKIDMHLKKNKANGIAIDGIPIRKAAELFPFRACQTVSGLTAFFCSPSSLRYFSASSAATQPLPAAMIA